MGKKVTFLVIPDISSKPKRFQISKNLIKGIIFSCLITITLLCVLVFKYFRIKKQLTDIEQIKEANRFQKLHLTSLTKEIEDLGERLGQIRSSNIKLQILAGIKKPENSKQVFSIGGGIADGMYEFSKVNLSRLIDQMHNELENLELEIDHQEEAIFEMTTLIEERKSILDSTPAIWPTNGWVTSSFGYRNSPFTGKRVMHYGIDIASRRGTPIIATARGIVTFSGIKEDYGKVIVINHGYGFSSLYGHNSVNLVKAGNRVQRGDIIAHLGNTGRSTSPHLHYEIRIEGTPVNPKHYMLD